MPEVGTSDKSAASSSSSSSAPGITSGTASAALIKAAESASSADASPAAQPAGTQVPAGSGSEPATPAAAPAQPQAQPSGQQPTSDQQPADNQRIGQAVRTAIGGFAQKYGITRDTSAEDVRTGLGLLRALHQDPVAFAKELRSKLGEQELDAASQGDFQLPEADLRSQDGKGAYSDAKMREIFSAFVSHMERRLMNGPLKPVTSFVDQEKQARETAAQNDQRRAQVDGVLTEARKLEHFTKENEPAILQQLEKMDGGLKQRLGMAASVMLAYNLFLKEQGPAIKARAEQAVRDDLTRRANAGRTQLTPGESAGEGKKVPLNNVTDLARHMEKLAAAAG